ncbi:MAG: DUF417 family protein [Pseudomonadota bacterium]
MAGRRIGGFDKVPGPDTAIAALRWSLVVIFVLFGIAKFAAYEAEGVAKIGEKHPLLSWLYPLWGPYVASGIIGAIELATAACLAVGAWSPRISLIGGVMGVCTFLITLSIALGAPIWQEAYGAPFLGMIGQFLAKDLGLLAGCYTLALVAAHRLRDANR